MSDTGEPDQSPSLLRPLRVGTTQQDGVPVIYVAGDVDLTTHAPLDDEVARWGRSGADSLVLDFTEATHVDPTGLRAIIRARTAHRAARLVLVVAEADAALRKTLEITALEADFDLKVASTRDEALRLVREA